MALMLAKTYAAAEIAGYENRLAGIETRVAVLTWMVSTHIVLTIPVLWLLLRIAGKVGALS